MLPKVVAVAIVCAVKCWTEASPSNHQPQSAQGNPTLSAFFGNISSTHRYEITAVRPGGPLSSTPTSGQISFKTKTRNGIRGLLPTPPKLRLPWGKKAGNDGLDTAKRFLHITEDALVLEVEGEDECLSIARGPESSGRASVTVVSRRDAGVEPHPKPSAGAAAAATGSPPSPPPPPPPPSSSSSSSSSAAAGTRPTTATKIPVDGLFGVYNLLSGPFVAVISRSKLRYSNRDLGVEFRQVSKMRLIPVLAAPRALDDGQAREEARLLGLLALAFRSHQFYFSHAHDVTQTLQTLRVSSASSSSCSSSSSTPPPTPAPMPAKTSGGGTQYSSLSTPSLSSSSSGAVSSDGALRRKAKPSPLSKRTKRIRKSSSSSSSSSKRRNSSTRSAGGKSSNSSSSKKRIAGGRHSGVKPRGRKHRSKAGAVAAPTAKSPPPDTRFFWNLGVLGPLLELREELEAGNGMRNGVDNREGRSETTTTAAGAAEPDLEPEIGEAEVAVAAVDRWLTPVMSGFLQVERGCRAGDRSFDVMFVSRRSRLRQGTRYTRRGIDDGGNVANFVETEQTLLHEDKSVTSHVQIRGSIPVFWSSPTTLRYHPKVRIDPDQEASLRALRRHSEDLIWLYAKRGGKILFVNLIDKKKEQGALGEAFDAALKAVEEGAGAGDGGDASGSVPAGAATANATFGGGGGGSGDGGGGETASSAAEVVVAAAGRGVPDSENAAPRNLSGSLQHVWFDFHHECRNMHWENLDKLLAIVDREFGEQGFYHAGPGGEILSVQDGVVRTNCMDCLDRTNVVQSLLARRSMLVQLSAVGVDIPGPKGADSAALALTLDMLEMPAEELERRFRDVWGNNADEISMLYAGTPALKGDFTRTGQRTKMGLLQDGTNSAIRYVVNNFQDHRRQESVDLLLGFNRPVVDEVGNILGEFIKDPLDLDLWATRLSQPQQPPQQGEQRQRNEEKGHKRKENNHNKQSKAAQTATKKRGGGAWGGPARGSFLPSSACPPLAVPSCRVALAALGAARDKKFEGTGEQIAAAAAAAAAVAVRSRVDYDDNTARRKLKRPDARDWV